MNSPYRRGSLRYPRKPDIPREFRWPAAGSVAVHLLLLLLAVNHRLYFPPVGEGPFADITWIDYLLNDPAVAASPEPVITDDVHDEVQSAESSSPRVTTSALALDQGEPPESAAPPPVAETEPTEPAMVLPVPAIRVEHNLPQHAAARGEIEVPIAGEMVTEERTEAAVRQAARELAAAEAAETARLAAERAAMEKAAAAELAAAEAERNRAAAVLVARTAAQERAVAERKAAERIAAEKAAAQRSSAEQAARERAAEARIAAEKAETARVAAERVAMERTAAEKATAEAQRKRVAAALAARAAAQERDAAERKTAERIAAGKAAAQRAAAEKPRAAAVPADSRPTPTVAQGEVPVRLPKALIPLSAPREGSESSQPRKVFEAPLQGDVLVEFSGKGILPQTLQLVVLYRDYPRNRHRRPMTAAEARRVRTLAPRVARIAENTVQLVIETAADGIYEFRGAADTGAEGSCVVTLSDPSGKKIVKGLGNRKIGAGTSVVKVMMPEKILWEDDSSFNGSMEDAESTTKYNSESGLVWKEYKQ